VSELREDSATFHMNRISQLLVTGDDSVIKVGQAMKLACAGWVHRRGAGDLEPRTIGRESSVIFDVTISW